MLVNGTKRGWNVGEEEVFQDGRENREGFLSRVLYHPPETLEDHVQGSVLRWRRDKGKPEHFVDRPDSADVLGEASLGVHRPV